MQLCCIKVERCLILGRNYFQLIYTINVKTDSFGAAASGLCLIHCLVTPFLFVAQSCAKSCCSTAPTWWLLIDYLFLILSLVAIYFASRRSSKQWVSWSFYLLWFVLTTLCINESVQLLPLKQEWIYAPALGLIALHLYNRRYCRCENDLCVTN